MPKMTNHPRRLRVLDTNGSPPARAAEEGEREKTMVNLVGSLCPV